MTIVDCCFQVTLCNFAGTKSDESWESEIRQKDEVTHELGQLSENSCLNQNCKNSTIVMIILMMMILMIMVIIVIYYCNISCCYSPSPFMHYHITSPKKQQQKPDNSNLKQFVLSPNLQKVKRKEQNGGDLTYTAVQQLKEVLRQGRWLGVATLWVLGGVMKGRQGWCSFLPDRS